jgi:hypothetical protein
MAALEKCLLCNSEANTEMDEGDVSEFKCKTCGTYKLHLLEITIVKNGRITWEPWKISAYVREKSIRKMPVPVLSFQERVPAGARIGTAFIGFVESEFPKTVADRLDRTLLNLEALSHQPGDRIKLDPRFDYPIAFAENGGAFDFLFSQLRNDGYIEMPGIWPGNVTLTVKGWNRVAELQRGGPLSKQVFVAMSFDNSLGDAWASGFKPGIEDCKYDPLRVDLKQHNEKICDVIVAEIRKSKFLVADFTLHRNGVYFEAGLMMGLGRPVIFTCRMDELGKAHFDTRQYNHIAWENPAQLREQLKQRIQATIPP